MKSSKMSEGRNASKKVGNHCARAFVPETFSKISGSSSVQTYNHFEKFSSSYSYLLGVARNLKGWKITQQ